MERRFKISKSFFATLLFLYLLPCSYGQVYKYSNEFLSIGVGARAFGMSGTQVASVNDVTAGFWNPAGLALIENDLEMGLMHSEYFAGIAKYDYAAIAKPLKDGKRFVGLSLIRFGVDDIPNTLFLIGPGGSVNYNNITSFSVVDYGVFFSYAQQLKKEGLRIGGNFKIIHRRAGTFAKAWGFGLDIGAQFDHKKWKFGVMAKDVTSTFNAWSFSLTDEEKDIFVQTGNDIPTNSIEITVPKVILGAAYYHDFSEKFSILGEINMDITTDGQRNVLISASPFSIDPHIGVEANYINMIFLRIGLGNIQRATNDVDGGDIVTLQPNIGLGIKFKTIKIDYALTDVGNLSQALYSHVFSLLIEINKKSL